MVETIITAIVSALGGGFATFMFFPQERRSKNIDNEAKESEEWRKLYECVHDELRERDTKIDALYEKISEHRDQYATLATEKAELEVKVARLQLLKCEVPSCPNRKPPTGY